MPDIKPSPLSVRLAGRLEFAVSIAAEAGAITLRHFRNPGLEVERKADNSPVTIADREAEQLLRERIAERFPDDAILGEEFHEKPGTSGFRWVLDPIDGTKSFIHGVPLYTTLVAVLENDAPRVGVIHAPACGETVYAQTGGGCWHIDTNHANGQPRRATVSSVSSLSQALVLTSEVASFRTKRAQDAMSVYLELDEKSRLVRTWGDGYGYLLVATGRAEVAIDPIVNLWDVAALQPVITEAGGQFTDWQGAETVHAGESIATNSKLGEEVLAITRQNGGSR